jgi:hypothetical protein
MISTHATNRGIGIMLDVERVRTVVAFWTLMAAVIVITWTAVAGPLMPSHARHILGLVAFGLVVLAHALPLGWVLTRPAMPVAASMASALVGGQA